MTAAVQAESRGGAACSRLLAASRLLVLILPQLLVVSATAADSAITLVALMFLMYSWLADDWSWMVRPAVWMRWALALWLWMLIISLFAYDIDHSYLMSLAWIRFVIFCAALEHLLLDQVWLRRLWCSAAMTAVFVALDGLWQYKFGADFFGYERHSADRLSGMFQRPKIGSYLMMMFMPVVVGMYIYFAPERSRHSRLIRIVIGVVIMVLMGTIFVSGERMPFLLALAGCLLLLVLSSGLRRRDVLIAGVCMLVSGSFFVNPVSLNRQLSTVTDIKQVAETAYAKAWSRAFDLGMDAPWLGQGVDAFRFACNDPAVGHADKITTCFKHPHHVYLEWFESTGIIGLIGFIGFAVAILRIFLRAHGSGQLSMMNYGPLASVLLVLWPIATAGSFYGSWRACLFWLMLGWGLAAVRGVQGRI